MFTLRLLGGLILEGPSGPASGRAAQRRRLALLALLGVAGDKGLSRDKLASYLWPESDAASARHLLSDSIYVLRKALSAELLVASGEFLRLDPEVVWCDVSEFERLLEEKRFEEALNLYAGPFLDGFYLGGEGEFDGWVEGERQRLADEYARALESAAEQAEVAGDPKRAVEWWKKLVAHDPYNSRAMFRLMEALVAAGDPANALELLRVHELRLQDELGLELPEDLRDFADRLRNEPLPVSPATAEAVTLGTRPTAQEAASSVGAVADPELPSIPQAPAGWRRLVRLANEVHRRSLWQVLGIYAVGAWIAFEVAQRITDGLGLPNWFPILALVFLAIGLPFAMATAFARDLARPWRTAGLSLLAAMSLWGLIAAGVLLTGTDEPAVALESSVSGAPTRSLAVLPFENRSRDPDNDYFAEAFTVELMNTLSRVPDIRIVPRASAFHFSDSLFDPEKVARKLNVDAVVTGTLAQHGGDLSISIELVDVHDNRQLWGKRYERALEDIFDIEEEIVSSVVRGLGLPLTADRAERLGRHYTDDAEAYQLYLRGRHLSYWSGSDNWRKAIEYFESAIARDPSFALAYAALSQVYVWTTWIDPPRKAFPKAKAAAEKALEIDETLAEAHAALASVLYRYDWDWEGAEREFQRALELNPGSQMVYDEYPGFLVAVGRYDEAAAAARVRHELDPLAPGADAWLGVDLRVSGYYEEAITWFEKAVELEPHNYWAAAQLAVSYLNVGMHQEAMAQADRVEGEYRSPFVGIVYAALGKREEALSMLEHWKQIRAERYIGVGKVAVIYDALGEVDSALVWYRQHVEDRNPDAAGFLNAYPEPWRTTVLDPRYEELVAPLAFPNRR